MADENGPTDPHGVHFTPQERRVLAVLADGKAHPLADLIPCLDDPLSSRVAIMMTVSNLRKKLERRGEMVLAEYRNRQCLYRHVVLLRSRAASNESV